MAQTGFTPIQLYSSSTPTNAPSAGNLTNDTKGSELAVNIADGKLFYKDTSNNVQTLADKTWIGTVTNVSALTIGTTGTDLSSTVANPTSTPVITLNVPTASAANRGALSSTDWSTFNNKQAALVSGTNIKTVSGTTLLGSGDLGTIGVGYGGTGTATAFTTGSVVFAGASGVYSQDNANLFWDNTNDRLGVGNAAPSQRLHIGATANASNYFQISGASMNAYFGVDANGVYIGSDTAAKSVNFYSAGSERARIFASGGVSIGNTTDPGATNLSVTGAITCAKGVSGTTAFLVTLGSNQSVTGGVLTVIALNTAVYNLGSGFDTTNYWFKPTVAGYYQLNFSARYNSATITNIAETRLVLNGGTNWVQGSAITVSGAVSTCSTLVYFNGTTDYAQLLIQPTNSSTVQSGQLWTQFSGALIRGA